jgi:hypothetical protein
MGIFRRGMFLWTELLLVFFTRVKRQRSGQSDRNRWPGEYVTRPRRAVEYIPFAVNRDDPALIAPARTLIVLIVWGRSRILLHFQSRRGLPAMAVKRGGRSDLPICSCLSWNGLPKLMPLSSLLRSWSGCPGARR